MYGMHRSVGALAGIALTLAACSDVPSPVDPLARPAESVAADPPLRGSDAEFARLAREIPGFGGMYFERGGEAVVYLTDPGQEGRARAVLGPVLAGRRAAARGLRVRPAKYDFLRLAEFGRGLPRVLSAAGVVFTDIDEAANRIRVGVADGEGRSRAESALRAAGIPRDAVVIEETEPFRFRTTLQDYFRPLVGGLQIRFTSGYCTLGFPAQLSAQVYYVLLLTNSHCTPVQGGYTPFESPYHQPDDYNSEMFIGFEFADPEYFTGGVCPSLRRCRYSDAALVSDWYGSQAFARIARTTFRGSTSGSLTIDPSNQLLNITADQAFPYGGEELNKVGRTTGWTYGPVTNTCVNTNVGGTNITLLCQDFVEAGVAGGDSGSPVFSWGGGSDVTLFGVLWGSSGTKFAFSAMSNIESELGDLNVF